MPRRSCLTDLIIAEELITGMTDQGERVDVVYLDICKAFNSVCHHLLMKKMKAMGIHPKITPSVEFPNNRIFRVKLGNNHKSEGSLKVGCTRAMCLDPFYS